MTQKFGDTIKLLRSEHGQSQEQLAEVLQISRSTLANYETNRRIPDRATLEAIADHYNVDMDYLYGRTDIKNAYQLEKQQKKRLDALNYPNIVKLHKQTIPVVGEVACGQPIFHPEDDITVDIDDSLHVDFGLIAKGDSMEPKIYDGDIVLIRQQPSVDNGQIAAVGFGDECNLKRVFLEYGVRLTLISLNTSTPPIIIEGSDLQDVRIMGLAVGKIEKW